MSRLKKIVGVIYRAPWWIGYGVAKHELLSNEQHARLAIEWLLNASEINKGAGFSHSWCFSEGWLPAYPETTGYIIPSLDLASKNYNHQNVSPAIEGARDWLRSAQEMDGGFSDLHKRRQVFDTGQILIGITYLLRRGDVSVREMVMKMCDWLLLQQEANGSFVKNAYNGIPHAYYSRVGAALIDAGKLTGNDAAVDAGIKNLAWTAAQQKASGWFDHMSFSDHPPFSHTIIYTLEGLLAGYRLTGKPELLDAVIRSACSIKAAIEASGGVIRSQYAEGYIPVGKQICVTGLCQWAALCFRLKRLGVEGFEAEADRSLTAAKLIQIRSGMKALNGGLPGSMPVYGRYLRMAIPNWGVKFFLDALLESELDLELPVLV